MRAALPIFIVCAVAGSATPAWCESRLPPHFVDAAQVVPGLETDMRYAGSHNFTGAPVAGYDAPRCWLTREAAAALARVQGDLSARGLGLRVFDCYRPVRAVQRFVAWAKAPGELNGKAEFFPDVAKSDLFKLGYIAARSSHSRGSTMDLTLVDNATGAALDMGTPFDLFSPKSHPDYPSLPAEILKHRALLHDAMAARGFVGLETEWWHFTLKDEPFPQTSFDAPIR